MDSDYARRTGDLVNIKAFFGITLATPIAVALLILTRALLIPTRRVSEGLQGKTIAAGGGSKSSLADASGWDETLTHRVGIKSSRVKLERNAQSVHKCVTSRTILRGTTTENFYQITLANTCTDNFFFALPFTCTVDLRTRDEYIDDSISKCGV